MENDIIMIDVSLGLPEDDSIANFVKALDDGYTIQRCYVTNNAFFFHLAKVEEEEAVVEPRVESVIQIGIDENPETVKRWTDQGWEIKNFYSKQVQLIKYRAKEDSQEEVKENVKQ